MSDEIQPFRIEASDEQLEDLQRRLRSTRWPDREASRLRGRGRVWLVFSSLRTFGPRSDEERLLRSIDASARRLDAVQRPGAAAYLYRFR